MLSSHTAILIFTCVSSSLFLRISDSLGLPASLLGEYFKRVSFSKLYLCLNLSFTRSFIHSFNKYQLIEYLLCTIHWTWRIWQWTKQAKILSPMELIIQQALLFIFLAFHFCLSRCLAVMILTSSSQEDFNVSVNRYPIGGTSLFSRLWLSGPTFNHLFTGINITSWHF